MAQTIRFVIKGLGKQRPPVERDQVLIVENVSVHRGTATVTARILENTFVCPLCLQTCDNLLTHRCVA